MIFPRVLRSSCTQGQAFSIFVFWSVFPLIKAQTTVANFEMLVEAGGFGWEAGVALNQYPVLHSDSVDFKSQEVLTPLAASVGPCVLLDAGTTSSPTPTAKAYVMGKTEDLIPSATFYRSGPLSSFSDYGSPHMLQTRSRGRTRIPTHDAPFGRNVFMSETVATRNNPEPVASCAGSTSQRDGVGSVIFHPKVLPSARLTLKGNHLFSTCRGWYVHLLRVDIRHTRLLIYGTVYVCNTRYVIRVCESSDFKSTRKHGGNIQNHLLDKLDQWPGPQFQQICHIFSSTLMYGFIHTIDVGDFKDEWDHLIPCQSEGYEQIKHFIVLLYRYFQQSSVMNLSWFSQFSKNSRMQTFEENFVLFGFVIYYLLYVSKLLLKLLKQ